MWVNAFQVYVYNLNGFQINWYFNLLTRKYYKAYEVRMWMWREKWEISQCIRMRQLIYTIGRLQTAKSKIKNITRRQFQVMFVTLILNLTHLCNNENGNGNGNKKRFDRIPKMLNWHKDEIKSDYKPPRNGLCGWMLNES